MLGANESDKPGETKEAWKAEVMVGRTDASYVDWLFHKRRDARPRWKPQQVAIRDLQLADVVELFEGPWGTGVVEQIKDGVVTIHRPYGTTADFSCTSGVITYVGDERVRCFSDSDRTLKVWERKDLK